MQGGLHFAVVDRVAGFQPLGMGLPDPVARPLA
jgi:hypothetical protein